MPTVGIVGRAFDMFTMESFMKIQVTLIATAVILVSGCTATSNTSSSKLGQIAHGVSAPAVVSPTWTPLTEGAALAHDKNYKYYPSEMNLSNGKLLSGDDWNGYLRAYVESFPPEKRGPILEGITRHATDYDKVEGFIRFEQLRYISEPYSGSSYIAVVGTLRPGRATASPCSHRGSPAR